MESSKFVAFVSSLCLLSFSFGYFLRSFLNSSSQKKSSRIRKGLSELIGNTPLIEISTLSRETGCTILAKAEFLNPGGTTKDRVARQIVEDAEKEGLLTSGGTIYEGTVGSTGISLAQISRAKGYNCHICMPNDQALEKSELLTHLGATVERVPPVSIIDPEHFCRLAERRAENDKKGFFANQFENLSNFRAHYTTTGPEIWEQTNGKLDAVVMAAGTGGTIAGVGQYLKSKNPNIKVFLIDPPGSGLFNKVKKGVCYSREEAEGTRKRHQVDTITEGIGINRITANFSNAPIDDAFRGTDQEAVNMARYLMEKEGLFVGSSSAMNCVGAVKAARRLGPGHVIVTILCDSGQRHLSKFWNTQYLQQAKLYPPSLSNLDFVQ